MKRSDVSEIELLKYIKYRTDKILDDKFIPCNGFPETPDIYFADKYPEKVIFAKMDQLDDKGYLDYGVSLRTSWITDKGLAHLEELKKQGII